VDYLSVNYDLAVEAISICSFQLCMFLTCNGVILVAEDVMRDGLARMNLFKFLVFFVTFSLTIFICTSNLAYSLLPHCLWVLYSNGAMVAEVAYSIPRTNDHLNRQDIPSHQFCWSVAIFMVSLIVNCFAFWGPFTYFFKLMFLQYAAVIFVYFAEANLLILLGGCLVMSRLQSMWRVKREGLGMNELLAMELKMKNQYRARKRRQTMVMTPLRSRRNRIINRIQTPWADPPSTLTLDSPCYD